MVENPVLKAFWHAWNYFTDTHKKVEKTPEVHLTLQESRQLHAAMGMAGEAGEVVELFKKRIFKYEYATIKRSDLVKELGDLFWYFYLMLEASDLTLTEVINVNADKLNHRYAERIKLLGSPEVHTPVTQDAQT